MYTKYVERPKLIVFDLNKTLIKENSWQQLNFAMGVTQREDELLVQWGREGIVTDAEGQALLCSIYKKRGNPTRERVMAALGEYTYMDGARRTVRELRRRGYDLALVSGSIDLLVEQIADDLGITRYAANNVLTFDENEMLERIETVDNDAEYKLDQLRRLCAADGIDVTEAMTVGDGANDTLLFEASEQGVTFAGSPAQDAAKYTITQLEDILNIVA